MYLDALTDQPAARRRKLNEFFLQEKARRTLPGTMTEFTEDDLRRIAFFMATGSGKTLLLHSHIRRLRHYLAHGGAHPEMLADRGDGRRGWDNFLLITPNEGLSGQHLRELLMSDCGKSIHFDYNRGFISRFNHISARYLMEHLDLLSLPGSVLAQFLGQNAGDPGSHADGGFGIEE